MRAPPLLAHSSFAAILARACPMSHHLHDGHEFVSVSIIWPLRIKLLLENSKSREEGMENALRRNESTLARYLELVWRAWSGIERNSGAGVVCPLPRSTWSRKKLHSRAVVGCALQFGTTVTGVTTSNLSLEATRSAVVSSSASLPFTPLARPLPYRLGRTARPLSDRG